MSEIATRSQEERIEALHRRLAENSLGGHWQDRLRSPKLVPHVWPWEAIYSCLMESGEVIRLGHIDEAAKRRTVNLVNPSLADRKATSRTLQMSVQLVKPGENAECHRHSAAALRFIVEGDGTAYTNVDGEQMLMEPGDLVLTPGWSWHDHHNDGVKNVVWLDVLDVHLIQHLDAMRGEIYRDSADQKSNYASGANQPVVYADGFCRQRLGLVRPRTGVTRGAPPFSYKWNDTFATLKAMASAGVTDAHDGILLQYTNPITGGPTMPTIGCQIQMLAPGETTEVHRHTSATIYHVFRGEGLTSVGNDSKVGKDMAWGEHDCFFVPSQVWHRHVNPSKTEPAIMFSVTDRPAIESLDLYHEENA